MAGTVKSEKFKVQDQGLGTCALPKESLQVPTILLNVVSTQIFRAIANKPGTFCISNSGFDANLSAAVDLRIQDRAQGARREEQRCGGLILPVCLRYPSSYSSLKRYAVLRSRVLHSAEAEEAVVRFYYYRHRRIAGCSPAHSAVNAMIEIITP